MQVSDNAIDQFYANFRRQSILEQLCPRQLPPDNWPLG